MAEMQKKWPSFSTRDLGDSPEDDAEMRRRWEAYDREMKALIATGGVHQDGDGWWVDNATGELIGPDPEIERPLTDAELAKMVPLSEALPELAASIKRARGRPKVASPKEAVTLRLSPETIARFKALGGADWRARMSETLEKAGQRRQ
ncbi:conserved hypothetical protein [uncultured Pleomorphomonas sp.]|uniref:BrnA antitoxin family protein n=1 Tax=uncultured Pleomorphomonas sp. TaxID=442121 RepID=A0A212LDH3_9HYPH|nr:BrnA antitoxin family protein [uncultured Pleomorphomonas sp.]SCM75613.1 conserved hypothetical protein [uncultured Pleomorphomonas sp.]